MKKEFGELVKHLRLSRQGYDENYRYRQWTRKTLAEKAKISEATLKHIENGEHTNPEKYVGELANALQLTEYEKQQFYAVCGLIYPIKHPRVTSDNIVSILERLDCPAYARTALWDFVAFNDYHRLLWDYDNQKLELLRDTSNKGIGPNLLRVLFEDAFQKDLTVQRQGDRPVRAMKVFHGESFQYMTSKRYKEIMRYFEDNDRFQQAWRLLRGENDKTLDMSFDRSAVTIVHPRYGELEFLSARIPERYVGQFVTVSVYHPLSASGDTWRKFASDVNRGQVHHFLNLPEELE